jgi:hypothetical protein
LLSIFWVFANNSSWSFRFPMFKIRSIAVRLILAISLTVATACAILGGFSISQQRACSLRSISSSSCNMKA